MIKSRKDCAILLYANLLGEMMEVTSFDGLSINYSVHRASEFFLFFVHGVGGDLTAWDQERAFFEERGLSTVALDQRGHGLSGRPQHMSDYDLDLFARDIKAVLDEERIDRFILIGHSFGGMVCINFHKLFPNLAKAYILIDTSFKSPPNFTAFSRHPYLTHLLNFLLEHEKLRKKCFSHVAPGRFSRTKDLDLARIFSDIAHTTLKSWIFTYEHISSFQGLDIIKSITQPVLIIEGEEDSVIPPQYAQLMHSYIKSSELEIVPGANHIIVLNNIDVLEEDICKYLQNVRGFVGLP